MLSRSTGIDASLPAFFDEFSKIAEETQGTPWVTKEKLKRLAIAVPVAGAGMFGGHFAGKALANELGKHQGAIGDFARKHPTVTKAAPMALAGLLGAAGIAAAARSRKIQKYVEHGDEDKRPK